MDVGSARGHEMNRREMLGLGLAAGAGALAFLHGRTAYAQGGAPPVVRPPGNARFPQPAGWPTELRQLGPNLYAYVQGGGPGQGSGGGISNAGVVVGDDHLLVIDTCGQPRYSKPFIAAIRKTIGNKPFGRVINTHQHGDHTAGNQFFMPAEIVGHVFCRESVLRMARELAPGAQFEVPGEAPVPQRLMAPTTTMTDRLTYYYGGSPVELIHPGVGHTWGDIIVYFPEFKVLFLGDDATFSMTPWAHNGHITRWLETTERILDMDVDTIIPGHGPIGGKRELEEMAEYFRLLKREGQKRFEAGMTPGRAAAEIPFGKFNNWIGSERNLLNTFRLFNELSGTLTPLLDVPGMTRAANEYNAIQKTAQG